MILFRYLARKFSLYVGVIGFLLAFIFNFIEFFEKMVRVKQARALTITTFLGLNFIPTFVDLLLIGVWLATCFLLKELYWHHEWELLQLLTYVPQRFFMCMALMGLLVSSTAVVINEYCGASLAFKADRFKQEHLKQSMDHVLMTTWLELDHGRFCYFSALDTKKMQGEDLLLISMSEQGMLQSVIKAPLFTVDFNSMAITIPEGYEFDHEERDEKKIYAKILHVPAFFSQLRINLEIPTMSNLLRRVIFYRHALPQGVYNDLLGKFFARLSYFLQILLCPLLVAALFMVTRHAYMRWVLALSAYPLCVIAGLIGDAGVHSGLHASFIFVPLLIMVVFIGWCWLRCLKRV
jgi:lipopolysaccharide export LptBFGC system permease protein LptF